MSSFTDTPHGIWTCKIGEAGVLHEQGLDFPMRQIVEAAYVQVTGQAPDFIFSGWRGTLTEGERAAHEDRLPDYDKTTVEVTRKELDALRKDSEFLARLRDAGVDNWEGYDQAFGSPEEGENDDPPCSGSGYAHKPHGRCPGYTYDRT
jgi:hypothetical protein